MGVFAHAVGREPGFTLVEILVVMVVLAVGLLGGEALLLRGLETSRSAIQRTQATDLAADLGDRIRANRAAGAAYALAAGTQLAAPAKSCATAGECDTSEVAARDLYDWQRAARSSLPEATTSVQVEPLSGAAACIYSILIRWAATGRHADAQVVLEVQA